jgi:hypothetical protein
MQVTARGFEPHSWHTRCCPVAVWIFRLVAATCEAQRFYSSVVERQYCKLKALG